MTLKERLIKANESIKETSRDFWIFILAIATIATGVGSDHLGVAIVFVGLGIGMFYYERDYIEKIGIIRRA